MVFPPRLRPGARVAVCAPSGPPDPALFDAGLAILGGRYRVVRGPALEPDRFLAAPDARRLADLGDAFAAGDVDAVWCARGGFGLLRIGGGLSAIGAPRVPIVGFSDVTILHAWARRHGVASVHGPNVTGLSRLSDDDRSALFALLEDPSPPPPVEGLTPVVAGVASGSLAGGNLCVLAHTIGTPLAPDLRGAIVLLEDVHEEPYRLDRLLAHVRLAGVLDGVAGVVCGDFHDCGDPAGVERVLRDALRSLPVPSALGLPVGHGARNRAVPLGARVTLDAEAGTLRFEQGAVS